MGKIKKTFVREKKKVWHEDFRGLKSGDYTLVYNDKSGRCQLALSERIVFSHINLSSCKNHAKREYGISEHDWRNL
jgi:hypothetical protein